MNLTSSSSASADFFLQVSNTLAHHAWTRRFSAQLQEIFP